MPQPIVLADTSGIAQGISSLGGSLGSILQKRAEEQKNRKYGDVLQRVLSNVPDDASPMQMVKAYSDIVAGTSPEFAKGAAELLKPMLQEKIKGEEQRSILGSLGLYPLGEDLPQIGAQQPQEVIPQQAMEQPRQNTIENWSNEQLIRATASGIKPLQDAANVVLKQREMEQNRDIAREKIERKVSDKFIEENKKLSDKVKIQENAINLADQALKEGVGRLSWANISDRLGIKELQSPAGAMLALASKYNIVGNIRDVSARAQNQWIEKRFSDAFPQAGQSEAANKIVIEYLKQQKDIDKSQVETFDRLSEQDRKKYGYVKDNIDSRVRKEMEGQTKEILKRTSYRMNKILENDRGFGWITEQSRKKPVKGTVPSQKMIAVFIDRYRDKSGKADVKKALSEMQKLGYDIKTPEELEAWD